MTATTKPTFARCPVCRNTRPRDDAAMAEHLAEHSTKVLVEELMKHKTQVNQLADKLSTRVCQSKVAYDTEAEADGALATARLAGWRGDPARREKRVYRCDGCGKWHLTSSDPSPVWGAS